MEKCIKQEELQRAVEELAAEKCPGPDGIPTEFFAKLWPTVGPTLTRAILEDLEAGIMHVAFTKGCIVLLRKKGDKKLLINKRPVTMLNVIYKILAKAYQLRLITVLNRYITQQQTACIPGRNIHHSTLLLSELIHFAQLSGVDHMLLKLDVLKAFDMLEWPFLLSLLERISFGPKFRGFLQATQATASSAIRINGKLSNYFANRRLVRQGCPLSPLLFIIAMDALNQMLQKSLQDGSVKGVEIPPLLKSAFHSLYADDVAIIMRADLPSLCNIQGIFQTFGRASGLYVAWEKTKAAFILDQPVPGELQQLGWTWESLADASKLLGVPIAQGISEEVMIKHLYTKLKARLTKARFKHLTLIGRVVIANHLVSSSLLYLLTLWAGNRGELHKLQTIITRFVWGGQDQRVQHRVSLEMITKPKEEGGLGLIAIDAQTQALSGRVIIWTMWRDRAPNLLRKILSLYIFDLSKKCWGSRDYTWVVTPGRVAKGLGSDVWQNIVESWTETKKLLTMAPLANPKEKAELLLWSPSVAHRDKTKASCKTDAQRYLRRNGFWKRMHVESRGNIGSWQIIAHQLPRQFKRSFEALTRNQVPDVAMREDRQKCIAVFM